MRTERALGWLAFLISALCAGAQGRCDSIWGGAVRLVASAHTPPEPAARKPVAAFGLGSLRNSRAAGGEADPAKAEPAIPADALWPDSANLIAVPRSPDKSGVAAAPMRNPWAIRNAPIAGPSEVSVACGGVIIGGGGGPAAMVNGRLVRRGDRVDRFGVAAIRRGEILLEQGGIVLVLPRGRPVTIRSD